jgi:hypothetical protein
MEVEVAACPVIPVQWIGGAVNVPIAIRLAVNDGWIGTAFDHAIVWDLNGKGIGVGVLLDGTVCPNGALHVLQVRFCCQHRAAGKQKDGNNAHQFDEFGCHRFFSSKGIGATCHETHQ